MELKLKEPELAPERNPRDYTVHFPQDKSHDPAVTKSYKTSGPVIPDTIRYQWVKRFENWNSFESFQRYKKPLKVQIWMKLHLDRW